jgi:hypothetical protein
MLIAVRHIQNIHAIFWIHLRFKIRKTYCNTDVDVEFRISTLGLLTVISRTVIKHLKTSK